MTIALTDREERAMKRRAVEPTFGIIKEVMGFRRFSSRGKTKVALDGVEI